ncbi:Retrovirus-related Pol polyprotein from transposon 17.6 [Araneus ventricosus]|uniref:RNA-directed DNA polymerase n=1 Tax=Araneus ventricosus TaxID=182803 RepID=A0A4Y2M8Q8_ARAVE|nr:Retrovirus-related Pol polyprotein from transposon 17.6 [Araneus ventricosus]
MSHAGGNKSRSYDLHQVKERAVIIGAIVMNVITEEHLSLLNEVLDRFARYRLKFNHKKWQFLTKLLGYILGPQRLQIDKRKTVTVNEFKTPENERDVKSFLGLTGFFRRYIRNFAKRSAPLSNLLRKDVSFDWNEEAQKAFDDIKNAFLSPPALVLPDPNVDLQVTTDASGVGIGVVLEQKYQNGEVEPLYFYSKKLNPS